MNIEASTPKVSVCVIAYNQQAYIGQCLQSIVAQQTDFEFEIIVGDDASTDDTRSVVQQFVDRYPKRIRPIYQEKNIGGGARNFRSVHMAATGAYVAHVDGDDYVLPGKLQAQADILDARPDVAFAAHAVVVTGSDQLIGADHHYPEFGNVYDLLQLGTYFVHSSIMYRRDENGIASLPEDCIDFYMHVERAARGAIYLDKRTFGAYRLTGAGLSRQASTSSQRERQYELAFDRANALGLDVERVERARLNYRMKSAVARCLNRDYAGYRDRVKLDRDTWRRASARHKFLSLTRRVPAVVHLYFLSKQWRAFRFWPNASS